MHETELLEDAQPTPTSVQENLDVRIKHLKFSTDPKDIPIVLVGAAQASQRDFLSVMDACMKSVLTSGYRQGDTINMHKISLVLCREFERAVQLSRWRVACFLVSALRLVEEQLILKQCRCADELQLCGVRLNEASTLFLKLV